MYGFKLGSTYEIDILNQIEEILIYVNLKTFKVWFNLSKIRLVINFTFDFNTVKRSLIGVTKLSFVNQINLRTEIKFKSTLIRKKLHLTTF